MKKTASFGLSALLAMGLLSGIASADELTAQQKFDALKAKGIFTGFVDGSAGLDRNMTRAQFARIAGLLDGLDVDTTPASQTFQDVAPGHWAYEEIEAAAKAGLFNGVGGGKFDPNGSVSKEQMATVMVRVLDIETDDTATVGQGVSDWAQGYVAAAVQAGLVDSQSDFTGPAGREQLVVTAYSTDELQETIHTVREENKPAIGKLLALDVMSVEDNQFGGEQTMSKADVLKALASMTNDELDADKLSLPDNPTFADVLRAYLQALGYPASMLEDADGLVDKAIEAGIVSADSPLLKIQSLNVPLSREWGSYLTAGTLFDASTVTVDSEGNVELHENQPLSRTMKLPSAPIVVELEDIEGVPTYSTLNSVDPSINTRLTPVYTPGPSRDRTAPRITAATINGHDVTVTDGVYGTITLSYSEGYLASGTISVSEDAELVITSIEGLDLGAFSGLLTQSLDRGANSLELIEHLGEIDGGEEGISVTLVDAWDQNGDGLVITGELTDDADNSSEVTLKIVIEQVD
ncbi:S-layer homology domain-containing protein [Paenibacillus sp. IB182496]|uniref:S-layer homology domain-containing protein n=1 Tax=Paenibacillus sabuli TaxID=2772509 RepID=A0A927BVC5_9BACL|nr:S-layer homology domain-containing protein [Paenibacillus sabuli]MBD2846340.1 S-layer homology domain-containing protein [Paenibacillus sabuli]